MAGVKRIRTITRLRTTQNGDLAFGHGLNDLPRNCKHNMTDTRNTTRRDFLARTSDGLFGAALAHLFAQDLFGPTALADRQAGEDAGDHTESDRQPEREPAAFNLKPKETHHPARATSVIQLFMNGGPSQMDLFDPKPVLTRMDGRPFPGNVEEIGNQDTDDIGVMMGGRYKFARHGECGMWMADVLPHTAKMADDICLVNSLWTRPSQSRQRVVQDSQRPAVYGLSHSGCVDGVTVWARKTKTCRPTSC